jgi:hypothetical protein
MPRFVWQLRRAALRAVALACVLGAAGSFWWLAQPAMLARVGTPVLLVAMGLLVLPVLTGAAALAERGMRRAAAARAEAAEQPAVAGSAARAAEPRSVVHGPSAHTRPPATPAVVGSAADRGERAARVA